MQNNNQICRILIVDNVVDYAKKVAYELEKVRPDLLENHSLEIEISNTAYFAAKQIENGSEKAVPWDIILSDVYMPIPSRPLDRDIAQEDAEPTEIRYENYMWKFWNYNYTWNSHLEGTPDHGGLYIAKKVKELRDRNKNLKKLKVVLISDKLIDPNARGKVFEILRSEKSWFNFYDKTNWEEDTEDWPANLNDPNVFRWAVIHAINERNSEVWGDSLDNDNETFLVVSRSMKEIVTKCKTMAKDPTVDTILLNGERGTGKSMLARTIHGLRTRESEANGNFVTVECTSISDELFESQLFGHLKGAFTGAIHDKVGFVETAKNGTLFFDEIGDLSPANQGKVLRLLQDREFVKVGSNENINMEAKLVVFATNKNLNELMENGLFRSDLYDRMKPPPLQIPSLKSRKDEIIALAEHFLKKTNSNLTISEGAKQFLLEQNWEGNVRQLKNSINQAATFCTSNELKTTDLKKCISQNSHVINSAYLPHDDKKANINITPENIVAGKIKWANIKKESYGFRSAIMIIARSMWQKPQRELAEVLVVNPNSLEQFFSTIKRKIRNGELHIQNLKPQTSPDHHAIIEKYFTEISNLQKY
jgi:DNA-binding NtrC family response regulator